MKHLLATIILLAFCAFGLMAQNNVSNTSFVVSDTDDEIVISYDLASIGKFHYFDIGITAELNGKKIPCGSVSGDVGKNIRAGEGKVIIWDYSKDVSFLEGQLTFKVNAVNNVPDLAGNSTEPAKTKKKAPTVQTEVTAGLGKIALSGLGLLGSGVIKEIRGQEQYTIYTEHLDERDEVYADTTRDDIYKEANKDHRIGVGLMYAGGAILVADGVILLKRVLDKKKADQALNWEPTINYNPSPFSTRNAANYQVGIKITF
jgi:hypothetical protein